MAEVDVTVLLARLTSYSEALDRHTLAIQQAYDRALESLANLRRVYGGAAAEDFFAHWNRTTEAMERYLEGTRGIKEILDARISTLREADRPLDQGASTDGAPAPQSSAGGARAARVDVSPNVTWDPSDHALGPNGLPHFDGTTYARVVMGDTEYFIRSGAGEPGIEAWNDPNIKAGAVTPSHVEGHAAVILRRSEVSEATLFINIPRVRAAIVRG